MLDGKVDMVNSRSSLRNGNNMPDPVDTHVGQRLKLRREILRLSQAQVARAVGVTFQQIQKYEQGRNRVSASRLYDICRVLGVAMTYLFQGLNAELTLKKRGSTVPLVVLDPLFERDNYMERTETLELIRAFWRIPNPRARQELLALIQILGPESDC